MDLPTSIDAAGEELRTGGTTCVQLTRAALERIEALQPRLNAFLTVTADAALAQAARLDRELRSGTDRGPLHGIPFACKDCLDTAGVRTTVGSRYFADRVPASDAVAVARLAAAGAVMVGKTNMNEFAAGTSGKNAIYGDVRNPWALDHSPGGSSSGAAAAVASGMALAAVGTDAGGSIRVPAACTGIVGIRPSFGRVPVAGSFPRSFSFDVVGPLARCVRDCSLLLRAMAPAEDYAAGLEAGIAGLRLGVLRGLSAMGVDREVEQAVAAAVDQLRALGAQASEVDVPGVSDPLAHGALLEIMLFEFNRILGEAFRACRNPDEVFGPVVCANIRRGMEISAPSYRKALAARADQAAALRAVFAQVDALVTPVLPMLTPRLDAPAPLFDRQRQFMIPFSSAGLPAISIPCGAAPQGLPIGMQVVGDRLQEGLLFRVARAYESTTEWHTMPWRFTSERGGEA
ncbi:MAG: amidase [Burkholderiales bacterium]